MSLLPLPDSFSLRTALRDARSRYRALLLYSTGIIAGVAALVAILSFRSDILLTVQEQSRELLGADLEVRSNSPVPEAIETFLDSLGERRAVSLEFSSMVLYGGERQTRLSQIRAIEGPFPFYGRIRSEPVDAARHYQSRGTALVERSLMEQLALSPGDSIRVGNRTVTIEGALLEVPGESAVFSLIGPRVYLPASLIRKSGLLDRGSRVRYKSWVALDAGKEIDPVLERLRPLAEEHEVRFSTVESRQRRFARITGNLVNYLGLIGFIALMLGGLGVASAVTVYLRRNRDSIAVLRCLGASSGQTVSIYLTQVLAIGLAGSAAGAAAGLLIQKLLPLLFADFLPFDVVQRLSVPALLAGLGTGIVVSAGFALYPLASINRIPPLLTLRRTDETTQGSTRLQERAAFGLFAFLAASLLLWMLLGELRISFLFTSGLALSLLLLLGLSTLLIRLLQRLRLRSLPYVWRQGISNLFRPNNQTAIVLTILGMGMMLIGLLQVSQETLLERIRLQTGGNQPNLVFYDIQSDQNEPLLELLDQNEVGILQNVPIVSMRLTYLNGRPVREIREDTTADVRNWTLTREYRVTYREELTESESVTEGRWIGRAEGLDSTVPISLGSGIADDLNVTVGDSLRFDVQGVPVATWVASIREIDFQRPEPNFFVLFPAGVLEHAPRFYATAVRSGESVSPAELQQIVVQHFPNVSAIDIGLVLESVEQFLDKVAVAIRFMALFTLLTGLIVLSSSIAINRRERMREAILLRTIGASRSQAGKIQMVEYALLGSLASLAGITLSLGAGWLLARFWFELPFGVDLPELAIAASLIIFLTVATGYLHLRKILERKPLEMLRHEGE